jgi:glycosyltransferase involved in cell wall biosynthesis
MKVLHLISSGGFYGVENMLINLTTSLEKLGHQTIIGLFHNSHRPNTELGDVARRQGLCVETIICRGKVDRDTARAVRACIERHNIDVVHTHGYKADIYGYYSALHLGKPIIATCHSWARGSGLGLYTFLDHLLLRRFDAVVAVSAEVSLSLQKRGIPSDKITTISNGVDISAFKNASPAKAGGIVSGAETVIGVVSRLVPRKGVQDLLQAAKEVVMYYPNTRFLVVGDGPLRGELEELARKLGIAPNVVFLGHQHDMPGVYAAMDIFALPSWEEGLPMSVLEAQAARKPVIATAVGGIPDLVRQDQTGILIRPREVLDLRDAILRLLADPHLRARLGNSGGDWVDTHYSSNMMASKYETLYEQVV